MLYSITTGPNRRARDAGEVQEWLIEQGLAVEYVQLQPHEDGSTTYIISADQDPRTVLDAWTPQPSPEEKARAFLTQLKPAIMDGTATQAQLRNAILALVTLEGI